VARTPEGSFLTERHRQGQLRLNTVALADLLRLWNVVDPLDLPTTIGPFAQAAAVVTRTGHGASAALAARYYSAFRQVEGARGAMVLGVAPALPSEVAENVLRGAGLAGIKNARARGAEPAVAARNGFVKMAGSATGLLLGGGRDTLLGAIGADPEAKGWQRVTDAAPCAFCRMLAGRGAVYKDSGATFKAHGSCGCTAEPFFEGSRPLPANEQFRQEWEAATQGLAGTEAMNAYRRSLTSQE
jgi:hypothetical protein